MSSAIPVAHPMESRPSYQSSQIDDDEVESSLLPAKRSRVALACQRCKHRKQKCDGNNPCSKCEATNNKCEYIIPPKPLPFGKQHYIKALEHRVAELETMLAAHGLAELGSDHYWGATGTPAARGGPPGDPVTTASSPSKSPTRTNTSDIDINDAVIDWQDGVDSVSSVLRSLSLDVNGSGYVGASSHIAFGRLFSFIGGREERNRMLPRHQHASTESQAAGAAPDHAIEFIEMPGDVAERLFGGYQKHIATRWPIIHSIWGHDLHQRRHILTDLFETTMLHLVYATSGRFIESTGESGNFFAKRHYFSAVRHLDTILGFNDIRSVQFLMLMAVYCLRDPVGAGAWTFSRTALLIAIDNGMHRQTKALSVLSMRSQLRKRLFWACYSFDRQISIPMGRPFGISDRDIDIELPLDINEDSTEAQLANIESILGSSSRSSTLTSFIKIVQLRQIESDIQQTIYRVDKSHVPDDSLVDGFLSRLESWKASIPRDTRHVKDADNAPFDGYDYYLVYFYKCQRLLLYPQISKTHVTPRFLKACAQACAGVCGAYKRLHQALAVGYSLMALQTVFMAGLTLVYCLWISPEDIFDSTTSNGIHDCSIVLFVIADRVPAAKRYRNAFEVIRQRVIDRISTAAPAERRSRETVPGLTAELAASASYPFEITIGSSGNGHFNVDEGSLEQLSHIITDMAGEQIPLSTDPTEADVFSMSFPHSAAGMIFDGSQEYLHPGNINFAGTHGANLSSFGGKFPSSHGLWSDGSY